MLATVIYEGVTRTIPIFFQPTYSKGWQNMDPEYTPLGSNPRGQYLYIGPVDTTVGFGATVKIGTREYRIRRAELILDQNGPVYWWALCVEKGGEDLWGGQPSLG